MRLNGENVIGFVIFGLRGVPLDGCGCPIFMRAVRMGHAS